MSAKYAAVDGGKNGGKSTSNQAVFSIGDEDDEDDVELDQHSLGDDLATSRHGLTTGTTHEDKSRKSKLATAASSFTLWNVWNTLTFAWMQDLLRKGYQKPLDMEDLYPLLPEDTSYIVYKRFRKAWKTQLREIRSPSLIFAFFNAFGTPFCLAGLIKLVHDSSLFVGPLLLNQLIKFLDDPTAPSSTGFTLVALLFLTNFTQSLCLRQYFWLCFRTGMNLRSAVISSVYAKTMVLSAKTLAVKTTGEITNLMAVDSSRLQDLTPYLHAIWYSAFQIILAMTFLWQQMGVSCLAGIMVIICMIPVSNRVSFYMKSLQQKLSKIRDERVKVTNEVLSGMKVIKVQAWEGEFNRKILEIRARELENLRIYVFAQCSSTALYTAIPLLVSITTFGTYIALGNQLDIATALTSLALFELLRFPLFMLPQVVNNVVEALVSVERIQSYLLEPECPRINDSLEQITATTSRPAYRSQPKPSAQPPASSTSSSTSTSHNPLARSWTQVGTTTAAPHHPTMIPQDEEVGEDEEDYPASGRGGGRGGGFGGARKAVGIVVDRASFIWDGALRVQQTTQNATNEDEHEEVHSDDEGDDAVDEEVDPEVAPWHIASYLPVANATTQLKVTNQQKMSQTAVQSLRILRDQFVHALQFTTPASSRGELSRAPSLSSISSPSTKATTSTSTSNKPKDNSMLSEVEITKYITAALLREQEEEVHRLQAANRLLARQLQQAKESSLQTSQLIDYAAEEQQSGHSTPQPSGSSSNLVSAAVATVRNVSDESLPPSATNVSVAAAGPRVSLTLSHVSFVCDPGSLTMVVGSVGAGKSSLLQALLGQLRLCHGRFAVSSSSSWDPANNVNHHFNNCSNSVAYCAQIPFIANATLRDNILFGQVYDVVKYARVLDLCALTADLAVLPARDMTEIGERGINLSGGQKARVSLARAVYSEAEIVLLDDPLSAVDAHVGKHLFEVCILDYLVRQRRKCVVLVTNQLQCVRFASQILVLQQGRIVEQGTYEALMGVGETSGPLTSSNVLVSSGQTFGSPQGSTGRAARTQPTSLFAEMMQAMQDTYTSLTTTSASATTSATTSTSAGLVASDAINPTTPTPASTATATATATSTTNADTKADTKVDTATSSTSTSTTTSTSTAAAATAGKLITTEDREVGDVSSAVYATWATAAGGLLVGVYILVYFSAGESTSVLSSYWLSLWSQHTSNSNHDADSTAKGLWDSAYFYLAVYALINLTVVCLSFGREYYMRLRGLQASKTLFAGLLTAVLYAPMSFFDTTPLGRVINRFSKDIYTVDEQIPYTIRGYLVTTMKVLMTLAYICIITPIFVFFLIPMAVFYYFAQRYYIKTSRELTRLESTARSPIYALFAETLDGLFTLRAYAQAPRYLLRNAQLLNANQRAYFLNFSANCWLAVRLEFVGTLIVAFSALCAVLGRMVYLQGHPPATASDTSSDTSADTPSALASVVGVMVQMLANQMPIAWTTHLDHHLLHHLLVTPLEDNGGAIVTGATTTAQHLAVFAGLAGLAISLSMSITQSLNWTVRMASDLESQMVSVERIAQYSGMGQEAAHHRHNDPPTRSSGVAAETLVHGALNPLQATAGSAAHHTSSARNLWPQRGRVVFANVSLRYRPGLPLVLNNVSFAIQPGEKVGIVGRTGAGKSSLLIALLRLVDPLDQGSIYIDDLDIAHLGLHTLRASIAVIPQDPVLFSGTIRDNLDPFHHLSDEVLIEEGLRKCHLLDDHTSTSSATSTSTSTTTNANTNSANMNNSNKNTNSANANANTNANSSTSTSASSKKNSSGLSLDFVLTEGGSNLSVGQRQLLCIARALLSNRRILLLDEATAAVDLETDALLQATLRGEACKDKTILTIAHRLNTILDSDKVLILEKGRVAEFDAPQTLLQEETSLFSALVKKWESNQQDE